MIGTIVNVGAIVVGSSAGALLHKNIKERYKKTIMQGLGLVAMALGMTWITKNMNISKEPLLFIVSIVIGGFIGELLQLDQRLEKRSGGNPNGQQLMKGLTTAVLLFCIGTMSILGPIESALNNNHTLLFTNAMLDGMTSLILASTFGIGIMLSAGVLFLWQGSIFLLAHFIAPYVTPEIMAEISIIGGILILSTGMNILEIVKIRTINLIPALIIPVIYFIPAVNDFLAKIFALIPA